MDRILIIGAKGLAKEILYSFPEIDHLFIFFDDINVDISLYDSKFVVLNSINQIKDYFKKVILISLLELEQPKTENIYIKIY